MQSDLKYADVVQTLDGSTGITYLMFLGRETYPHKIQESLVSAGIFKNKENVNQAIYRLLKYDDQYLQFIRKVKTAGMPKIYTADFNPIFVTLEKLKQKFDVQKVKSTITLLSGLNDHFPSFIIGTSSLGDKRLVSPNKLRWNYLLAQYFFFLLAHLIKEQTSSNRALRKKIEEQKNALIIIPILKNTISELSYIQVDRIPQENYNTILKEYPNILLDLAKLGWGILSSTMGELGNALYSAMFNQVIRKQTR